MQIYDWIGLEEAVKGEHYQFKAVFNERGIILFPSTRKHMETKVEGICYDDSDKGNALGVIISPKKIEIRYHKKFQPERVKGIVAKLIELEGLKPLRCFEVTYQGKTILNGSE